MGDMSKILAGNRVFSGTAIVTVLMKFSSDRPLLPWQRKLGNFNTKFAITRRLLEMRPEFAAADRGFRQSPIPWRYSTSTDRPLIVAMVTRYGWRKFKKLTTQNFHVWSIARECAPWPTLWTLAHSTPAMCGGIRAGALADRNPQHIPDRRLTECVPPNDRGLLFGILG